MLFFSFSSIFYFVTCVISLFIFWTTWCVIFGRNIIQVNYFITFIVLAISAFAAMAYTPAYQVIHQDLLPIFVASGATSWLAGSTGVNQNLYPLFSLTSFIYSYYVILFLTSHGFTIHLLLWILG